MGLTILLSLAGCALLFFGIWGVTVTMPTKLLAKNFPEDVQERLRPRLEEWERQGMSPRRFLGWVILILFCAAYLGLHKGFSFWRFFFRFLIIGGVIKAFDIGALGVPFMMAGCMRMAALVTEEKKKPILRCSMLLLPVGWLLIHSV